MEKTSSRGSRSRPDEASPRLSPSLSSSSAAHSSSESFSSTRLLLLEVDELEYDLGTIQVRFSRKSEFCAFW